VYLDVAVVGRGQPLADLDGRRLAGAVRPEQTEALARTHLELDSVYGDDVFEGFAQIAYAQRSGGRDRHPILVLCGSSAGDNFTGRCHRRA
jgi:hypothetical protein